MTFAEFEAGVLRTANTRLWGDDQLVNAALGLTGETGEFADMIKKYIYHDHPLDRVKALKELGDVLFYLTWAAHNLDSTIEEVAEMNAAKLAARYPNGFNSADSLARLDIA